MLLNQIEDESNPAAKAREMPKSNEYSDFQEAASKNSTWSRESARLCGHPEQQALAQAPSASSMMDLMVRAQRPHSALQPRQP